MFRFSKRKLAQRLGRLALRKPGLAGKRREIFDATERLFRLASADRRLRGRLPPKS